MCCQQGGELKGAGPDGGGWVVVGRAGKNKGAPRTEAEDRRVKQKEGRKRKRKVRGQEGSGKRKDSYILSKCNSVLIFFFFFFQNFCVWTFCCYFFGFGFFVCLISPWCEQTLKIKNIELNWKRKVGFFSVFLTLYYPFREMGRGR